MAEKNQVEKFAHGRMKNVTKEQLQKLLDEGLTVQRIADSLTLSGNPCKYHNVYDKLSAFNLLDKINRVDMKEVAKTRSKPASRKIRKKIPVGTFRSLANQGLLDHEMAEVLNLGVSTISRYMKQYGLRKAQAAGKARRKMEDKTNLCVNDAEKLDILTAGNPHLVGFIPDDGKIFVILKKGGSEIGFWFKGDFDLVSGEDLRNMRDGIRKNYEEALKKMSIAGLINKG